MSSDSDSPKAVVIIGDSEPEEPDNYQQLKSLLEQLIALQEELMCGFPDKPEPILAGKYNQLRGRINHLLGHPNFVENVPEARNYNSLLVTMSCVLIWLIVSGLLAQWADQTTVSVLEFLLTGIRRLLDAAAIVGLLVFVYGYHADPGKFKALLHSRNRELRDMVRTLYKYAWDALNSLPSSRSGMTDLEKAQGEEILRLRMEIATMQGKGKDVLKEQYQMLTRAAAQGVPHLDRRGFLQRLQDQYTANLWRKQEQRAMYGINVPTEIENEIAFWQRQIAEIDKQLNQL
jgi:hypothetical protein